MIFDAGIAKADFRCKCEALHLGVSIGEEILICSCGDSLMFKRGVAYYDYFWVPKEVGALDTKQAYESDARNLC